MVGQLVHECIRTRQLYLCVDEISGEICVGHVDKRTMELTVMDLDGADTNMNGPYGCKHALIEWGEYNVHIYGKTVE
jgi:hypothetical protein